MELGNIIFGNSRGEFEFPDRYLVRSKEWGKLMRVTGMQNDYHCTDYENDTFKIMPYWWGDEDAPEAYLPNFLYKPTGFEIQWYKYPFRDSYMNQNLTCDEIKEIFAKCVSSVKKEGA